MSARLCLTLLADVVSLLLRLAAAARSIQSLDTDLSATGAEMSGQAGHQQRLMNVFSLSYSRPAIPPTTPREPSYESA